MDLDTDNFLDEIAFPAKGVRATMIQNSSGGWVDYSGSSRGLSCHEDLTWMLAHRYVSDCIVVGSETAIQENYQKFRVPAEISEWRNKKHLKSNPLLITTTNNAEKLDLLITKSDYVVIPQTIAPISSSDVIIAGQNEVDWNLAIEKLNELGLIRINFEGGPALIERLIEEKIIDQFVLTTSPIDGPMSDYPLIAEFVKNDSKLMKQTAEGFKFWHIGELPNWEQLLTVGEYFVLRDSGTQAPFSVDYEKKPAAGYYTCRSCGVRLFDASDQFDARCGWPAFWKPNDNANLILEDDFSKGYVRVEVKCGTCESHLGHVFHGEGFGFPTDDRYCINAICLVRKYD